MSDSHSPWSTIDPLLLAVHDRKDREESSAIGPFEQDIDSIFNAFTGSAPGQDLQMGLGMDAVDLAAMFNDLPPHFLFSTPAALGVSPDGPTDTANSPASPTSDYTVVASPPPCGSLDKDTFLLDGDEHGGDHVVAPRMDTFDDFQFTFMSMHPALDPAVTSVTPPISYFPFVSTGHGYGHPGSQQEGIAADTVAYGPADGGVRENENDNMFSFSITTPSESASPSPSSSPPAQDPGDAAAEHAAGEEDLSKKRQRNPSGAPPAKRRRVQSTARTYQCPYDDCEFASARNNNLQKHIKSVHEGERPFACKQAGCLYTAARKHDAERHFVSKHTGDGSPRRESKLKRALKAKAKH